MKGEIGIVYRKELRDLLRDRRTIISMIVVPVVIIPLLMVGMVTMMGKLGGKVQQESPKIMVLGGKDSPKITAALKGRTDFTIVAPSADFTNLISDKKLSAAVELPKNFDGAVQAGEKPVVKIYTYEGEYKSINAWQRLDYFFRTNRDAIVSQRLAERNLSNSVLTPFVVVQTNVASPEKVSGNIIGMILPYLMIVMCLTGAIYPAVDLTAGEKERGTMETILVSPVARTHLVLGKALVVLTVSLATAVLSLCANGMGLILLKKLSSETFKKSPLLLAIDPTSLAALILMVVPLAIFFSGALLAIGLYSRSAKEANSYFQPLMIMTVMPAAAAAFPGVELNYKLALVPIMNISLAGKEIMAGTFHWNFMAVVFVSMCVYAAIAVAVAVALFKREDVLFRT